MTISEILLPEFDHEMANTRKTLERVPDDKMGWKPHEKSGTMGWLATHLANLPHWGKDIVEKDSFDIAPAKGDAPRPSQPKTRKELLEVFDRNVAGARAAIAKTKDDAWYKPWSLMAGGKPIFTQPKIAVVRNMMMAHSIHHRGQLSVYFRLNNVPVPGLYGPSADEK